MTCDRPVAVSNNFLDLSKDACLYRSKVKLINLLFLILEKHCFIISKGVTKIETPRVSFACYVIVFTAKLIQIINIV